LYLPFGEQREKDVGSANDWRSHGFGQVGEKEGEGEVLTGEGDVQETVGIDEMAPADALVCSLGGARGDSDLVLLQ
jgi:hypothetical protein